MLHQNIYFCLRRAWQAVPFCVFLAICQILNRAQLKALGSFYLQILWIFQRAYQFYFFTSDNWSKKPDKVDAHNAIKVEEAEFLKALILYLVIVLCISSFLLLTQTICAYFVIKSTFMLQISYQLGTLRTTIVLINFFK